MAVYVDPLRQYGGSRSFRWKESCHLFADTVEELHAFALRVGLRREWFQGHRPEFPHYDLVKLRRMRVVSEGAVEVTTEFLAAWVKARRSALSAGEI